MMRRSRHGRDQVSWLACEDLAVLEDLVEDKEREV